MVEPFIVDLLDDGLRTPFFVLDLAAVDTAVAELRTAFSAPGRSLEIYYMLKCNTIPALLKRLSQLGCGMSVSHDSEIELVRRHASRSSILVGGPSVDGALLQAAAPLDVRYVSLNTATAVSEWRQSGLRCEPLLRISSGPAGQKFGLDLSHLPHDIEALHSHAGTAVDPVTWNSLVAPLLSRDDQRKLKNVGGGFLGSTRLHSRGQALSDYAAALRSDALTPDLLLEPGRYIAETAMTCATTVTAVDGDRVYVDVGSNLLPPLLSADYRAVGVVGSDGEGETRDYALYDCGCFGQRFLPSLRAARVSKGDVVMIENCGAYTFSLWSSFGAGPGQAVVVDSRAATLAQAPTSERHATLL
ncbi:MAG: hypothetical protein ABI779_18520 [Acidobacteriota bacterium]